MLLQGLPRTPVLLLCSATGATAHLLILASDVPLFHPGLLCSAGWSYNASSTDPSEAGALAATLWDLTLLRQHYHPHTAQAATSLLALAPGRGGAAQAPSSGPLAGAASAAELTAMYNTSSGSFRPAPQPPKTQKAGQTKRKGLLAAAATYSLDFEHLLEQQQDHERSSSHSHSEHTLAGGRNVSRGNRSNGVGSSDGMEQVNDSEVIAALQRHYSLNRRYKRNAELRGQAKRLLFKLSKFHQHLHEKEQEKQQQQKQKQRRNKYQADQQSKQQLQQISVLKVKRA